MLLDYAQDVWLNKIPAVINDAPEIGSLLELLKTNKEKAFEDFGKKLGNLENLVFYGQRRRRC